MKHALLLILTLSTCGDVAYADEPIPTSACNDRSTDACFCVDAPELYALRAKANALDKFQCPTPPPAVETGAWGSAFGALGTLIVLVLKAWL